MAQVYLSDLKSLRRFDFEQSTNANRRSKHQTTQKSKKQHLAQEHLKAEEQKKKRVKVKKNRETSEEVVHLRNILQPLRVNAKYVHEHKKFKGEFGIFLKDYSARNQPKKGSQQEHRGLLIRFPNEMRHNDCRTQMKVVVQGSWAESSKEGKKVSVLIMVEVEKDWEVNAKPEEEGEKDLTSTEDGIDYPYPLDYDSSDEESNDRVAREKARREEKQRRREPKRRQISEKWYLLEKNFPAEGKPKCECCNYDLINVYDDKEVELLMKQCEKKLRNLREGKLGETVSTKINQLVLKKQEQQEQQQEAQRQQQQQNEKEEEEGGSD